MALLANDCINSGFRELARALTPALKLNALLFAILWLSEWFLLSGTLANHPLIYLLTMGIIGVISYIVCFLLLPISGLETEVDRWKNFIHSTIPFKY